MGFYRLIYRIGKMIFRDFLFKIPKKYLVIIILFLTLFIVKTNVFAYSDYDMIPTDSPAVDCVFYSEVRLPLDVGFEVRAEVDPVYLYGEGGLNQNFWYQITARAEGSYDDFNFLQMKNTYFNLYNTSNWGGGNGGIAFDLGNYNNVLVNRYREQWGFDPTIMTTVTFRLMTYANSLNGTSSNFVVTQGDTTINSGNLTFGNDSFNSDGDIPLIIGGNGQRGYFYNWKGGTSNADDSVRVGLFNYYPCKMIDTSNGNIEYLPGAYDTVSGFFVYFDDFIFDDNNIMSEPPQEIQDYTPSTTPTPTPTPEPTPTDYTGSIDNVNNSINNLNNTITDSNISNSVIQQPSVPTDTSGVETGVNNVFANIMNAFTHLDSTQNVVFPIPFTDKNITLQGSYTRDMLTSVNAIWIITFITIFWWYLISRFIIKDILKMVDKIQEGNLDKVESSNIKGDML